MATLVTQAEFARANGWTRSYVSQLKKSDRLVMQTVGGQELVDPVASLLRIEATEDKARADVKERWSEHRKSGEGPEKKHADEKRPEGEPEEKQVSYQKARAVKEAFAAKMAQLVYEKEIGKLVEASTVAAAGAALGVLLRTSLENMEDESVAELAAESDPEKVRAILSAHHDYVLREIARQLGELIGKPQ